MRDPVLPKVEHDAGPGGTEPLPFPDAEYAARHLRLRESLASEGLAGGLYFSPEDIYYLSGYNTTGAYYGFQALVVPTEGDAFFICRSVEEANVALCSYVTKRRVFTDTDDPVRVAVNALQTNGVIGKLEIDADSVAVSPRAFEAMKAALGPDLNPNSRCLHRLRRIKSQAEIQYIAQAAGIVRAAQNAAFAVAVAGSTENQLAAACYSASILAGGDYPGMPPMIASGNRAGLGHVTWDRREIREGDLVLLEIPGCVKRYHAVQSRCVSVGEPSAENERRMSAVLEARDAALAVMHPGTACAEVDRQLRTPLDRAGYGPNKRTRAGYSLGIAYPPHWDEGGLLSLRSDETTELQPGMVFHLLASVAFFNETLIANSETVLITNSGPSLLTSYPPGFVRAS